MKQQNLIRSLAFTSLICVGLLPGSCVEDHRPPLSYKQLLTGCTAGWAPRGVFHQPDFKVGQAAPDCYRMICLSDRTVIFDRSRCTTEDTSPVMAGTWLIDVSSNNIYMPRHPSNLYGPKPGGYIDQFTATLLEFSWRGGSDRLTERWVCE